MKIHYFAKITLEVYLLSGMENSKRYKIQNRDKTPNIPEFLF